MVLVALWGFPGHTSSFYAKEILPERSHFSVYIDSDIYFFPFLPMATIIERDVHHHDSDSSSSSAAMIVGIVAIVIIVGLVLFALKIYPFSANTTGTTGTNPINVNVNASLPAANSYGQ